jgi:ketosteroid isomerase-like protein
MRRISEQNIEITRRFVEDFNGGGVDALVDFYDPEIEYREDPKFPQAEVYRGRDAIVRQWREFYESFSEYRVEIEDLFGVGDKVVGVLHEIGRGMASGAPVDRRTGWVFTFRAGKVLRMEIYLDPADALEAVGVRQ